jgi:hypothetical protein
MHSMVVLTINRNPDSGTYLSQLPRSLLMFGHNSANFRTYFKNKSVLEILQSAKSIGTTRSTVINARHFDRGCQSWIPRSEFD